MGFPGGSNSNESACNAGDLGLILHQEDHLKRGWVPTPVFLLGEFHGQRSLASCSPWGNKESDKTKQLTLTNQYSLSNIIL